MMKVTEKNSLSHIFSHFRINPSADYYAVDVETGEVFDGVQRNAKFKRLYNAPWVTMLFVEYFLVNS